ncbi:MAG TPA: NAD-dependent epimerase/dehydratase family protein [Thermoguttaceae bacterium]|nr:NAD-dependent epimerase/dehydratase family protein [Thermoguttaceae bacterium]
MATQELHVVTGAFGYSGKYIAKRLLAAGHRVRTLTNSLNRPNPFGDRVEARPFDFQNRSRLVESLEGAAVLYNTYWVRFDHGDVTQAAAVENTLAMFEAAKEAGVSRVVHVSITNPSEDSPLEYFRCKARLERGLIESGLSYAILRPPLLFGKEDILVNNIAWCLRRLPVFGVFGNGRYRLQPIYVDDLAKLAVEQGAKRENCVIDAIGPETFTFRELVKKIARIIGKRRLVIGLPAPLAYLGATIMGKLMGDVIITRAEVKGLMSGLLYVDAPPAGTTRLTQWARENADQLGIKYASELARRKHRDKAYEKL